MGEARGVRQAASGRMRLVGWALAAVVLTAAPAGAQPGDYGLTADSLGLAADAEPLQVDSADTACDPLGLRVVRDSADARAMERFRDCGPGAFPSLGRRLYAHVVLGGDCHATHQVHAYRSAARREYRIVMTTWYGGCRSARFGSRWITLPPLPEGWTVAFTELKAEGRDRPWRMDALGPADDAAPLPVEQALVHCRPEGFQVVRDSADARGLRRFPGCEPSAFPALGRALYVRVPASAVCDGRYGVRAYRSDARREYRVVRVGLSRGCGGTGGGPRWFRLPPLPGGWTVAFAESGA